MLTIFPDEKFRCLIYISAYDDFPDAPMRELDAYFCALDISTLYFRFRHGHGVIAFDTMHISPPIAGTRDAAHALKPGMPITQLTLTASTAPLGPPPSLIAEISFLRLALSFNIALMPPIGLISAFLPMIMRQY